MSDMKAIKLHLADPGHHMYLRCFFFSFFKDVFSNQGDLLRNYQGNINSRQKGPAF